MCLDLVLQIDQLALLLVLGGVRLRVAAHAIDLVLGQTRGGLDADLLLLAGALVDGRDVQDAVGVDVEGHLDLRDAPRCRGDAVQVELAQRTVVLGELALACSTWISTDGWLSLAVENT